MCDHKSHRDYRRGKGAGALAILEIRTACLEVTEIWNKGLFCVLRVD